MMLHGSIARIATHLVKVPSGLILLQYPQSSVYESATHKPSLGRVQEPGSVPISPVGWVHINGSDLALTIIRDVQRASSMGVPNDVAITFDNEHTVRRVINKGSSPISGEGGADLQEEVCVVPEPIRHPLDDFDLVVDALDEIRSEWPSTVRQNARQIRF